MPEFLWTHRSPVLDRDCNFAMKYIVLHVFDRDVPINMKYFCRNRNKINYSIEILNVKHFSISVSNLKRQNIHSKNYF